MNEMEPVELVGPPVVASALGLARPSAVRLMQAGLAGRLYTDGQREMVERSHVAALAGRPLKELDDLPPALIVRAGPPHKDGSDDSRDWYGWHAAASKEARRAGVSRWWVVRDADQLAGQLFVVTVSGIVVDVARIAGAISAEDFWAFRLTDPADDDSDAHAWHGLRLRPVAGGAIMRHGLDLLP